MVETRAELGGRRRVGQHLGPVEQQVVVVEHLRLLLGLDVAGEQPLQLGRPADPDREAAREHGLERLAGIHHPRVDLEARALLGEAALGARQAEAVPNHVHQVGGVAAVVDGEGGIEADLGGVVAQDAGADGVEGAGPGEAGGQGGGLVAEDCAGDALDAALHLDRGASGEGHSRMRRGSAPWRIRWATRCASVLVLPVPAPAMTSSGRRPHRRHGGRRRVELRSTGRGGRSWDGGRGSSCSCDGLDHVPHLFAIEFVRVRLANRNKIICLPGGSVRPSLPQERREAVPRSATDHADERRQRPRRMVSSVGKLQPGGQQKAMM